MEPGRRPRIGSMGAAPPGEMRAHPGPGRAASGSGSAMRVVLAEKPSVARELASFLGATTRREGYFEGRGYQVTWALGHLATLKDPDEYDPALKKWSLATLPFAPARFELKPRGDSGAVKQLGVIR